METTILLSLIVLCLLVIISLAFLTWHYRKMNDGLMEAADELSQQRVAVLDMLNRIGVRVGGSMDLDGALGIVAEYVAEATHAESGAIFLLDSSGEQLEARATVGLFPPMNEDEEYVVTGLSETELPPPIGIGEGIIGFVGQTGESVLVSEGMHDTRVPKVPGQFAPIHTLLAAPLKMHQKTLGVAVLINRRDRASFTQQDQRLLQQLGAQAALTVDLVRAHEHEREQRRLEQELEVAHNFQSMLLPREIPKVSGLDIAAYSTPALELGGDYYDFIWVEKPLFLGVAIADVSGKGVPGALVMTILRSALRTCAPGNASPKRVLENINRMIIDDTKQNVFITMTYAIIDVRSLKMRFVRAGHEPLVLVDENSEEMPKVFQPKGIALGLVAPEMFTVLEEEELQLQEGQTVMLYTDGVVEAVNEGDQEYSPERFHRNLIKHKSENAGTQIARLLEDIHEFTGGIPQNDDITVATVKVVPKENGSA